MHSSAVIFILLELESASHNLQCAFFKNIAKIQAEEGIAIQLLLSFSSTLLHFEEDIVKTCKRVKKKMRRTELKK